MRYPLFLVLLILPFLLKGQLAEVDSLQKVLAATNSIEPKTTLLNKLSTLYARISLAKSEQYARRALDLATASNFMPGMADAYNNLGVCASIRGLYSEGLDYFLKALRLREKDGDKRAVAKTLINISGVYLFQKDYDKAISYSERSLNILQKEDDPLSTGNAQVALAEIYAAQNDTITALNYYFQALDVFGQLGDKRPEVQTLIKIGLLEKDKEKEKILNTCLQTVKAVDVEQDFFVAIDLYKTIAELYVDLDKHQLAYQYFHRALSLADRYFDNQAQIKIRSEMSDLFQKDGHYDSALWYYKSFASLNEKTYSAEKSSQLVHLEKVYESEKKDQQIVVSEQKIQSLGAVIGGISLMLVLLCISGFVLYRYYRQKREANLQLQKLINAVTSQARELQVANSEIKRINEHLEEEVNNRTKRIQIQNEKLIDYVHFNSHQVRAPVARILGLSDLMSKDPSVEEVRDISDRIQIAAQELDQIIRELNKKLETD